MVKSLNDRVREHRDFIVNECGFPEDRILGVFLYGSQNYGTDLPTSDVDTKAIIIPTEMDAIFGKLKVKEYHLPNDEHCEVMDIRHLIDNFKKQNINFTEILYTDYKWVNPRYAQLWQNVFVANREKISHYDMQKAVVSICGQAIHTLKQNPRNGKKLSNGTRLKYFLENYVNGQSYAYCIYPNKENRALMRMLKESDDDNSETLGYALIDFFEFMLDEYKNIENPDEFNKEETDKLMQTGAFELILRGEEYNE